MQLTLYLHFQTNWGERIFVKGDISSIVQQDDDMGLPMSYKGDGNWELELTLPTSFDQTLSYHYEILREDIQQWETEFGPARTIRITKGRFNDISVVDRWRSKWEPNNALYSTAFSKSIFARQESESLPEVPSSGAVHRFELRAIQVAPNQALGVVGNHPALGAWDITKAVLLSDTDFPNWQADVLLTGPDALIEYKYVLIDNETGQAQFETRQNRSFVYRKTRKKKQMTLYRDEGFVHPAGAWRGSGVAIPVFSLRSLQSTGVGEFLDLKGMIDWSKDAGISLIQILPINDTVATHTWVDSYPYAAISVYALHPIYLNPFAIAPLEDRQALESFEAERKRLNDLSEIDYEAVMNLKSAYFKAIFDQVRAQWEIDPNYRAWFQANEAWLRPYAAFSALRDRYHTADFSQWGPFAQYDHQDIWAFTSPEHGDYEDIAIHYFIQYHLHLQLKEVADYARSAGVVLKGDIPIGIYRHSVDAWMYPYLYHMDQQAGAPPDDFAVAGQNWRFPTYNWEEMAKDGFAWWRTRMTKLAEYFDAYRIDHILGFFRIWQIPGHAVQGIMGQFNPSLPFSIEELQQRGIWWDEERLTQPYIRWHILELFFENYAESVKNEFLEEFAPGRFRFQHHVATQRAVENYIEQKIASYPDSQGYFERIRPGLFALFTEVIFLPANGNSYHYDPRVALHFTYSYRELSPDQQAAIDALYNDYFYHRHEDFWRDQALIKLPALKDATDMLVCGEDLGMVPACVPPVMRQLGLLSLEIQRMPKDPTKRFAHPADASYLSVVSTSTHDMPTIRGWWEANPSATQRFYNEQLGQGGGAPFFCEPWIAEAIVWQHFESPAMWAILPIQDLLAMDGSLRREDPHDEQINIPAIAQHYWRYRMHISVEELQQAATFTQKIRQMVHQTHRM